MPVKPEILKVRTETSSRFFRIESLDLRFSNGVERTYERLANRGHGGVMIIAITDQNELVLVREYAAGLEDYSLSFPKGHIDAGEEAHQAANRELKEEAGFGAHRLDSLREVTTAPSYQGSRMTFVVARDLYPCTLEGDEPEPLEVVLWPLADVEGLLDRAEFNEGRAIAALLLTERYLKSEQL
ncbi:MAG: ADP compounds hydrolase NudE [Pontibacterium sp.]